MPTIHYEIYPLVATPEKKVPLTQIRESDFRIGKDQTSTRHWAGSSSLHDIPLVLPTFSSQQASTLKHLSTIIKLHNSITKTKATNRTLTGCTGNMHLIAPQNSRIPMKVLPPRHENIQSPLVFPGLGFVSSWISVWRRVGTVRSLDIRLGGYKCSHLDWWGWSHAVVLRLG